MSLTILIHRAVANVGIVRWFRDPVFSVAYSSGPLVQMSAADFRRVGYEWVRRHFDEYATVRLREEEAVRVFQPGEERDYVKGRVAVWIKAEESGSWKFIPQIFKKHNLAGTENLPKESRRSIPANCTQDIFWETMDKAVADALAADG